MKLSSLILILLLPAVAYSQSNDYNLDSYVNPDYKRKELDFILRTSSELSSIKSKGKMSGIETFNNDSKNNNISGDIGTHFYQIANSIKKQTSTNLILNFKGDYLSKSSDYTNDIGSSSNSKNKIFVFNLNYNQESYYYVKDKKFIEFSPSAYFNYNSDVDEYDNQTSTNYKSTSTNLLFKLGVGKGRIEQVEDAYLAMYVLYDLKKNGSLNQTLNPDEINMLAQQITSIKNKRRFDSRIKLIEEISTIDSFFTANGYTDAKTAPYFTSLYDNWMYAGLFKRAAGSRISFGVSPGYWWANNKLKNEPVSSSYSDFNNYSSEINASVYASYRYEKPVNLFLQHSILADVRGEWLKTRGEKNNIGPRINGEYALGYYPNTRTHVRSSLLLNYFSRYNDDITYSYLQSGILIDLYYYLSPQLRINANGAFYLTYNNIKNKIQNQTNTNRNPRCFFNFGLQYSIF